MLDLWKCFECFFDSDIQARSGDSVGDQSQHVGCDGFGNYLKSALEWIDRVDEIDVQLVEVHESVSQLDETFVSDFLHLTCLNDGVYDYMLANLFNLGFGEVWVALPDDFGDKDLVGRLRVDAPCSSPCEVVILKDVSLEIVEVGLDDLLDPFRRCRHYPAWL